MPKKLSQAFLLKRIDPDAYAPLSYWARVIGVDRTTLYKWKSTGRLVITSKTNCHGSDIIAAIKDENRAST